MSINILPSLKKNVPGYVATNDLADSDIYLITSNTTNIPIIETEVDTLSLKVFSLSALLYIFILYHFNINEYLKKDNKLFLLYLLPIVFYIYQIFNSAKKIGSYNTESTTLSVVETLASIFVGIVVLFIVFSQKIPSDIYNLLTTSLVINSLLIIYVSVPYQGEPQRCIRKIKQSGLSLSIFIFCLSVYIISKFYKK